MSYVCSSNPPVFKQAPPAGPRLDLNRCPEQCVALYRLNAAAPPAPSAPPPHKWGGAFLYLLKGGEPLRRLRRHLPMNGEEPFLHLLKGGEPGCPSFLVGRDFWVVALHQRDLV